ncbi:outer membrane lipoprotein-sorting protein [Aliikangiella coralliicola]|uniref:Outer membrane lipoprotein-sorting protein n=1 Tax=Aliikangiella coralliicola TaxID=2592383 RepID=A0A545UK49_9GAMM|nr:outer membrane lipoprotein-sorting protein [Aliikangiella coralliicola]TQV89823.1 outer membrane lipoprotein-sorting protein [Aliikangiella coralliicola]
MFKSLTVLLLSLISVQPISAFAQTAAEKGLAIAVEADKRDLGWQDSTADMLMILSNKQGEKSERKIRIKSKEVGGEDDGDKSLTVFDSPKDVKGTAFLSYSHIVSPDDQWLYLPALKRVKRISSSNKSGPFMGSEFAFEDLSSFEVGKYTYQYLREEDLGELKTFVIEYYPTYKHSGYKKLISWIDQKEYRVLKTEFYDRKNDLLKTLTYSDYQHYLGKYWRSHKMSMVNHQSEKTTELLWSNYQFRVGLDDSSFNRNSLKRIR